MKRIILAFLLVGISSSMCAMSQEERNKQAQLDRDLREAALNNDLNEVKRLIEKEGADINATNQKGWTALMVAASGGLLDIVKYLIERGANINVATPNGWTALIEAVEEEKHDIVKYLIEHGANINAQAENGWAPLLLMASVNNYENVKYLIERGADVNVKNNENQTALILSAKNAQIDIGSCLEVVKLLYYFMYYITESKPWLEQIGKMEAPREIKNWLLHPVYTQQEKIEFFKIDARRRRNKALKCTLLKRVPKAFFDIAATEKRGYKRNSAEEESARKKLKISEE